MTAITKSYNSYELPLPYAPSSVPSAPLDPTLAFIQETQKLVDNRPKFSYFSFSDISKIFSSLGHIPTVYENRSVNICNSTHVERRDSEEIKEARKNQQMILSTVIAAIYSFVLGRQLGVITEEQRQKDQCDEISSLNSAVDNSLLQGVAAARKAVHERNLEDACFYRNISISAIASSALVFVGAVYAAPAAGIAGATLGFGTVVYGMVQWGASSVSKDTLTRRYEALAEALTDYKMPTIQAYAYPIS